MADDTHGPLPPSAPPDYNQGDGNPDEFGVYVEGQGAVSYSSVQKTRKFKGKTVAAGEFRSVAGRSVWHKFTDAELAENFDNVTKAEDEKQKKYNADVAEANKLEAKRRQEQQQQPTADPVNGAAAATVGGYNPDTDTSSGDSVMTGKSPWEVFQAESPVITGREKKWDVHDLDAPHDVDKTDNASKLLDDLRRKSPDEIKALQQKLKDAGASVDVTGIADADTSAAYGSLLQTAFQYQHAGNKLTPDELLDSMSTAGKAAAAKARHKSDSSTSTSVSLTDPVTARATLEQLMTTKLGRKPTDFEISQFTGALNSYEGSNPTTTTQTSTSDTDADGNTVSSSSSNTSGSSSSPSAFAGDYLRQNHGAEQQSVDKLAFWNIALQALGNSAINTGLST